MRYQKSLEIEQRLSEALRLIQTGRFSTPLLADTLGVSIPTVSRYVTALRERGHDIRAERHLDGWRYIATSGTNQKRDASTDKGKKLAGARSGQR
jgi:biotin operon repressor